MTGAAYDLQFANAVRLAASGIRPKAGADPEACSAELRCYLRSTLDLDRQGLDLLADLVVGRLRTISQPPDETRLAHAVRLTGLAWRSGKDVDAATRGGALATMLRDPMRHLGTGERGLLADLVMGEHRRGVSRPPIGAGHPHVVEIVETFRVRIADGEGRKEALYNAGLSFNVSSRTVEKYLGMVRAREIKTGNN